MNVKFSRHAKRRAKLYKIPESVIISILQGKTLSPGVHEIVENVEGFHFPVKIVVRAHADTATLITNYPLRKGREK